jgi:1-acyl-sn-glycerol-3-phosphate acyltransferase
MADAKVIPFDDDRSRGGAVQRPPRRRSAGSRRKGDPVGVREVQHLPGMGFPRDDVPVTREEEPVQQPQAGGGLERRIAGGLAFLRRRLTGDYEIDEFGYDQELTDQVLMSLIRPLYEKYFRVEVKGIENIPSEGGALIVANHSGTLPLDGLMMQVAVHDNHPANRHLRLLAADLVFMLPVVNELARKAGHTLACAEDAERLLERGELVGVMPEGFKGVGKPFSERYKLQRFGRGGFVSTALRQGTPIIPCSIVGAEEIYPMIGNAKTLARLLGFPYPVRRADSHGRLSAGGRRGPDADVQPDGPGQGADPAHAVQAAGAAQVCLFLTEVWLRSG